MWKINDGPYLISLLAFTIGVPVAFEQLYPGVVYNDDPLGLGIVVPLLCIALLFAGLLIPARLQFEEGKQWIKWPIMLAATVFSLAMLGHDVAGNSLGRGTFAAIMDLLGPGLAWGWQGWIWFNTDYEDPE